MRPRPPRPFLLASLAVACTGAIEETAVDPPPEAPAPAPGPRAPAAVALPPGDLPCAAEAGFGPLRRLTRAEYDRTVRDLLGFDARLAAGFAPDEKVGPFDANVSSPVSEPALEDYLRAAGELARRAAGDPQILRAIVPCTGADAACGRTFVERFGLRAYRRPLAPEEVDRLHRLVLAGLGQGDFALGVRLALQAMLSSPHFLYHLELGAPGEGGAVRALDPYELAARLSYFLWGSMPDAALLEAARTGEIARPGGLEAQARRLAQHDRARASVRSFLLQWLEVTALLDRDQFESPIGPAAVEEIARLGDALWAGEGGLPSLLTTRTAHVEAQLWRAYGLPGTAPSGFTRVELDPRQRSGVLTRVAVLAAHRTPTARGKYVRAELLCQHVPPPPPDLDSALPPPDPDQPPRARWEKHVADPACGGCHRLMDPIGFGFEHYDELGRHRTRQGAWPVDARGELIGTERSDGPFVGAIELSERLAASPEIGRCAATRMLGYALGRLIDEGRDRCALAAAGRAFAEAGHRLRPLLLAVAGTDAFRLRRVEP